MVIVFEIYLSLGQAKMTYETELEMLVLLFGSNKLK